MQVSVLEPGAARSGSAGGWGRGAPPLRLAFAGGGTGGHVVPGRHLLPALRQEPGLADLLWLTSGRAVEDRALAGLDEDLGGAPFERVALPLEPRGGGAPSRAALALRTPRALLAARSALARHRSEVLLGLGGFTALPAVLAARSLGVPVLLLEVNATRGAATRWLAPLARSVLHARRTALPERARTRHVFVGPPLSPEVLSAAARDPREARREFGFTADRPLLLVLGGSQGAGALNGFLRAHASRLFATGLQVLHQVGPGRLAEAAPAAPGYRAVEFLAPIAPALAAADLALSRGGASTLAELAGARVPAVVVPYPYHADRHQERNAQELGRGVRIVAEERLDAAFADELARLAGAAGAGERTAMRRALAEAVPQDAAARVAGELVAARRRVS